jgi:hypothetical protein
MQFSEEKDFFPFRKLTFINPLKPRGLALSLPPEKGHKESAKGGDHVSPLLKLLTRPLRRAS